MLYRRKTCIGSYYQERSWRMLKTHGPDFGVDTSQVVYAALKLFSLVADQLRKMHLVHVAAKYIGFIAASTSHPTGRIQLVHL